MWLYSRFTRVKSDDRCVTVWALAFHEGLVVLGLPFSTVSDLLELSTLQTKSLHLMYQEKAVRNVLAECL